MAGEGPHRPAGIRQPDGCLGFHRDRANSHQKPQNQNFPNHFLHELPLPCSSDFPRANATPLMFRGRNIRACSTDLQVGTSCAKGQRYNVDPTQQVKQLPYHLAPSLNCNLLLVNEMPMDLDDFSRALPRKRRFIASGREHSRRSGKLCCSASSCSRLRIDRVVQGTSPGSPN